MAVEARAEQGSPGLGQAAEIVKAVQQIPALRDVRCRVVSSTARRNCSIVRCSTDRSSHGDLIIKVVAESIGPTILAAYEGLERYQRVFAAAGMETIRAARPVGCLTTPPALVMEYESGSDLHDLLRSCATQNVSSLRTPMELCGTALGLIHRSSPADPDQASAALAPLARRLVLSKRWIRRSLGLVEPVMSAEDFAPNNIRTAADGIVVLDPPLRAQDTSAHSDIAHFLGQVGHHFGRSGGRATWRNRESALRELTDEFLRGYAEAGPFDPRGTEHRRLIAVFAADRALVWSIKYARRGELAESWKFARRACRGRVRIARNRSGQLERIV